MVGVVALATPNLRAAATVPTHRPNAAGQGSPGYRRSTGRLPVRNCTTLCAGIGRRWHRAGGNARTETLAGMITASTGHVDGACGRSNTRPIAPCRSTAMSTMLSAPATSENTFRSGLAPLSVGTVRCSRVNSESSLRPASAITGTSPAAPRRFGSSSIDVASSARCQRMRSPPLISTVAPVM